MKLTEAAERYIQFLKMRRYSPRSISGMERGLARFERYLMRVEKLHRDLGELTAADLDDYQRYLSEYRGIADGKSLGEISVMNRLLEVRRFFRFLKEHDLIAQSPAESLQFGKAPESMPKGLMTREEVTRIMAQPDVSTLLGVRDRALIEVLYGCGLRAAEIVAVDAGDVDMEKGFVLVRCGKGAKDRVVPLADVVLEWLGRYLTDTRPKLHDSGPGSPALWLTVHGKRLSLPSLALIVLRYKAAAKVKKPGTIHAFRHSIATHLLDSGLDLRYIQEFLGHEHIQTTERYTTVAIAGLAERIEKAHPRMKMRVPIARWTNEE